MISFALTCLTLCWVEAYLRDRNRHVYLLPLVMVVWANLHGGFVYGLAVVGLAAVTEAVLWLLSPQDGGPPPPVAPALAGAARLRGRRPASTRITIHAYLAAILTQTSAAQQTFIAEWHSPSFHSLGELGLELLLLLVVLAMAFRRPRLWDALLTVVGVYAALSAVRNAPLAAAAADARWSPGPSGRLGAEPVAGAAAAWIQRRRLRPPHPRLGGRAHRHRGGGRASQPTP